MDGSKKDLFGSISRKKKRDNESQPSTICSVDSVVNKTEINVTAFSNNDTDYTTHRWARVLGQGGCVHRGVSKKKFCGRLRRPKFFSTGV